jgi:hypothetical protein
MLLSTGILFQEKEGGRGGDRFKFPFEKVVGVLKFSRILLKIFITL